MYLSEIYAAGFRCFPEDAPLALQLQRGLNILVGPSTHTGKAAGLSQARERWRVYDVAREVQAAC